MTEQQRTWEVEYRCDYHPLKIKEMENKFGAKKISSAEHVDYYYSLGEFDGKMVRHRTYKVRYERGREDQKAIESTKNFLRGCKIEGCDGDINKCFGNYGLDKIDVDKLTGPYRKFGIVFFNVVNGKVPEEREEMEYCKAIMDLLGNYRRNPIFNEDVWVHKIETKSGISGELIEVSSGFDNPKIVVDTLKQYGNPKIVVAGKRTTLSLDGMSICYDWIKGLNKKTNRFNSYGKFMELEILVNEFGKIQPARERIFRTFEKLNVPEKRIIAETYPELLLERAVYQFIKRSDYRPFLDNISTEFYCPKSWAKRICEKLENRGEIVFEKGRYTKKNGD
ncbi:MAG: hypothetical protein ISS95_00300 [Candidatus Aenigmarchaeota archaeon]|nr:hypothetical protein [Candidatus Aenigmarchaeota archaeon]